MSLQENRYGILIVGDSQKNGGYGMKTRTCVFANVRPIAFIKKNENDNNDYYVTSVLAFTVLIRKGLQDFRKEKLFRLIVQLRYIVINFFGSPLQTTTQLPSTSLF